MASKYRKKFELPENFYEILENYSREVLRYQPLDIIEFSYLYFKALEEVSQSVERETTVSALEQLILRHLSPWRTQKSQGENLRVGAGLARGVLASHPCYGRRALAQAFHNFINDGFIRKRFRSS